MNLDAFIKPECIQIGGTFPDKAAVLRTIARLARRNPAMAKLTENQIFKELAEREKLSSTGFGNGIGIPHAAFEELEEFVVGMLIVPEGFDFGSLDGKATRLLIFIMVPAAQRDLHIRILSKISNVLKDPDSVAEILSAGNSEAARESFLRHTVVDTFSGARKNQNLFHVFVQNQERFEDVLNVFTEIEDCAITVIESNNARSYLYTLPLFASFWQPEEKGFCRIILASVRESLSNEVIRKINLIIEEAKETSGIFLIVQEIFYSNGMLNL
ncbi:MAG: PTS sugar transporter subunit IIA [Candidatus Marinimicrobia bacterium]|nr:PTS sugar transporter subunit IIA [Candidatus Neomarinimicrobiota bacterium]